MANLQIFQNTVQASCAVAGSTVLSEVDYKSVTFSSQSHELHPQLEIYGSHINNPHSRVRSWPISRLNKRLTLVSAIFCKMALTII